MKGRVLIVAGSDSGGGAGVQADIKTVTALGGYAATAITAITVQNTLGVLAVHPVAADVVVAQARAVLDDIGADAIKTGMLGSAAIARAAAAALARYAKGMPLVVDPVMVATSGAALADPATIEVLKAEFFPRAALITPNIPEATRLCGFALNTPDEITHAGETLLSLGPHAVLIKGGHSASDTMTDMLFTLDAAPRAYSAKRIDTKHTHGTGCALSAAIACGLGQGMELTDAVQRAHDFVQNAIRTAPGLGAGNGPLNLLR